LYSTYTPLGMLACGLLVSSLRLNRRLITNRHPTIWHMATGGGSARAGPSLCLQLPQARLQTVRWRTRLGSLRCAGSLADPPRHTCSTSPCQCYHSLGLGSAAVSGGGSGSGRARQFKSAGWCCQEDHHMGHTDLSAVAQKSVQPGLPPSAPSHTLKACVRAWLLCKFSAAAIDLNREGRRTQL